MINNGFDHFKYSVHIRFIRNTANPYSVYKKPNPNTANPYSAYKKPNPNSFISYSVYKKRNYSVPYIFGFGRIIRIRLTPIIHPAHVCSSSFSYFDMFQKKFTPH